MVVRIKAFLLHLLCSVGVALAALYLVFELWYAAPLHQALGVTHIFLLMVVVDVVLGPLLTLLVYKPGKTTLKFDVAVIVVLQLAALGYGLWTVAQGRPAWLVFNADRFDVVQIVDIDTRRLAEALPRYRAPAWLGPEWVAARRPEDPERRAEIMFEAAQGGSDVAQRPELYQSLSESEGLIRSRAQVLEKLADYNEPAAVMEVLREWPHATGWLPLMARAQPMVVLLGEENTTVLGIVALRPWPQ